MAKPAFIYAFDNLGSERFADPCKELLSRRCPGFLSGGVGPDGGVDGELDGLSGFWRSESLEPLSAELIKPGQLVIFQFKHKVTARLGEARARSDLLESYRCVGNKKCELHSHLVESKLPDVYVLLTNVEVNAEFRETFRGRCAQENPRISHYQVIGLDELESWISGEAALRHLYFPTIFEQSRFDLRIELGMAVSPSLGPNLFLSVAVQNIGMVASYVAKIVFHAVADGRIDGFHILSSHLVMTRINPAYRVAIHPRRSMSYFFLLDDVKSGMLGLGQEVVPTEVEVVDEIGNNYKTPFTSDFQDRVMLGTHTI